MNWDDDSLKGKLIGTFLGMLLGLCIFGPIFLKGMGWL